MPQQSYSYYKEIFKGVPMPFAFADLDLFDENIRQIKARAKGKKIRVASKSMRCAELIKRVLNDSAYNGLMTYSGQETVWLSQKGFDDFLIGYPVWNANEIESLCNEINRGKTITLMVDL